MHIGFLIWRMLFMATCRDREEQESAAASWPPSTELFLLSLHMPWPVGTITTHERAEPNSFLFVYCSYSGYLLWQEMPRVQWGGLPCSKATSLLTPTIQSPPDHHLSKTLLLSWHMPWPVGTITTHERAEPNSFLFVYCSYSGYLLWQEMPRVQWGGLPCMLHMWG